MTELLVWIIVGVYFFLAVRAIWKARTIWGSVVTFSGFMLGSLAVLPVAY